MIRTILARAALAAVATTAAVAAIGSVDLLAQCLPPVERLLTERKLDEARATLQAQLTRNPADDAAMECLGRVLLEQGASSDALSWLEKAVKINSRSAPHHLWLGHAIRAEAIKANKLRQPFLARRMKSEYELSVTLDGTLVDAHHSLFQFYLQAPGMMGGSVEKAREEAATLLKLNPMRGHLDHAALAEHDRDYPRAEKEFLAAIEAAPTVGTPYNATGGFYRRQQRWTEATAMYEKSLKAAADPRTTSIAHYGLALVHQEAGRRDQARAELQASVAANPQNEDAKKALAALK